MKFQICSRPSLLIGGLCVVASVLLPTAMVAQVLSVPPTGLTSQLMLGATIFRATLGVLGLALVIMSVLPIWSPGIPGVSPLPDPRRPWILFTLASILLVATALRLYQLNAGLWLDEILTDVMYARLPWRSIVTTYDSENQHLLYSLMAHFSFRLFGESAWALRVPAVIFGVGSIGAMYLVGREIAGVRESLLAAALLTFSYTHIWFSQNARGYSGLLFWTLFSSWFLLRGLRQGQPRDWLLYAMTAALGVYTHFTMLFVIFGQFVVYLWTFASRREISRNTWAGLLLGFVMAGLWTLLLHSLVLPQILGGMGRENSVVAEWKNPLWTVLEIVKGMQVSFSGGFVALGALAVFGAGLWNYARTRPEIILLFAIAPAVGAAVVIALGHHLWPRFFLFTMGFAVLIVMRGAMQWAEWGTRILRWSPARSDFIGTAVCAALILVSALSVPYAYGPKQDYAGALEFIQANAQPGDVVVTAGLAVFPYTSLYGKDWKEVTQVDALDAIRAKAKRTWFVYTFPTVLESTAPDVMDSIQRDFSPIKEFYGTVGDGTVFVSRSDSPPSKTISH